MLASLLYPLCAHALHGLLQRWALLDVQELLLRRWQHPDVQLLKFAAQKVHSHVHVDAVLAPLGMASSAAAAAVRALQPQPPANTSSSSSKACAVDAAAVATTSASTAAVDPGTALPGPAAAAKPVLGRPPGSLGFSKPPLSPSKHKRPTVVEFRLQDVAVVADVCEYDQVQLHLGLCKGSSCLEQAVVHGFSLKMNERELLGIEHLAVTQLHGLVSSPSSFASAAAAAAAAAGGPTHGPMAGGDAAGSWWDVPRGDSPDPGRGGASWGHGASSSMESVRVYAEGGGLQSQGSVDDPLPSISLGSAAPKPSKEPGLFRRQGMRQAAARERCEVRGLSRVQSMKMYDVGLM